jgi:hypothetical protein
LPYFYGETNFGFGTLMTPVQNRFAMTIIDRDYQAEARAAMKLAAAATSDADRLEWLRVAVAWHNLAHVSGWAGEQNDLEH